VAERQKIIPDENLEQKMVNLEEAGYGTEIVFQSRTVMVPKGFGICENGGWGEVSTTGIPKK